MDPRTVSRRAPSPSPRAKQPDPVRLSVAALIKAFANALAPITKRGQDGGLRQLVQPRLPLGDRQETPLPRVCDGLSPDRP
jgi:hypothetical protein